MGPRAQIRGKKSNFEHKEALNVPWLQGSRRMVQNGDSLKVETEDELNIYRVKPCERLK